MRVAAIYDIHGNLPALESVLKEIKQAKLDCVVAGGDVVLGPMSREALTCLLDFDIPVQFIQGDVQFKHTDYNLYKAAELMRAAKYPQAQQFVDRYVLNFPSDKEMLDAYTREEIGTSKKQV